MVKHDGFIKRNFGTGIGNRVFQIINYIIFLFYGAITFYPLLYVVVRSLRVYDISSGKQKVTYGITAYTTILKNASLYKSFLLTIGIVIVGTTLSVLVTVLTAYPLSRKHLRGRTLLLLFVIIPMLFSGGLIPSYILIRDLHLRDTLLVYILPGLVSSFNIVIAKNFLQGISDSIVESAEIDGANDYTILFKIIVPLSKPIIATLSLWIAVGKWNDWMTGVLYIKNKDLMVIQNYLRTILTVSMSTGTASAEIMNMPDSVRMASIVVGTLHIIIVYPFVQKYFVKGMILGSVKG